MTKSSKAEIKEDVVNILNHVTETLFYFFEENEENLEEDDEALDDFQYFMWVIANVAMAATGMTVTGRNPDGTINAIFKPVKSVKKFIQEEHVDSDGGRFSEDSDRFFEDMIDLDDPKDIDLGGFEDLFMGNK